MSQLAVALTRGTAVPPIDETLIKQIALDALKSSNCICGHHKGQEESFCKKCHHCLPLSMRAELRTSFRDGYAKHYDEALRWLAEFTKRLKAVQR
jgi:hypothetical protein